MYTHPRTRKHTQARAHTNKHTHTHACARAHTHPHAHTHTQVCLDRWWSLWFFEHAYRVAARLERASAKVTEVSLSRMVQESGL